jgi:tetratricopeptide (TPR) repeat protein
MGARTPVSSGGADGYRLPVAAVDSQGRPGEALVPRAGEIAWPVRSGAVPLLADGFIARPESAPALGVDLVPGAVVVLVPGWVGVKASRDWLESCGKTQLAVSCAESLWQSGGVDLLVWIAATSRASVLSGYVEAAAAAMGTELSGSAESVAARFVGWLSETSRRWLVVLSHLSAAADLDGLWPAGPAGRVLITTANSATVSAGYRARVLPVGAFGPDEALTYLTGRLSADAGQRLGAADLAAELDCEPLALAQASAAVASSGESCRDYLNCFTGRREQLAGPPAAAVTWTFSAEQAGRLAPDGSTQAVLALAALLDGQGIPGSVFTSSATARYLAGDGAVRPADPERAWGALLILERTGLLAIDSAATPPIVRMSAVVPAAVRTAMASGTLDRVAVAASGALLEVWPADDRKAWPASGLRSCAASLQRAAGDLLWADGCRPLLFRAGQSLDSAGLTGPAVAYWAELAAVSGRVLGPDHPDTLVAGHRQADAYLTAARTAEGVSWLQWVLADQARALGPDHPGAVVAKRDFGHALVATKQFGDALTILDGAASDYERIRGVDHPDTLGTRDELADAYRAAGQPADAIRLYRRTLADRERIQGPQHPDTMTARQKLADAYLADGRLKDALAQYKRVLADRERVLGPDHLDTIRACGNLASADHSAGRMASAVRYYEQASAGYERILGPEHPDTLACRANLAHAYYAVGRLTDATTLLRETVARCERALPPGDSLTRAVRESLANIAGDGSARG